MSRNKQGAPKNGALARRGTRPSETLRSPQAGEFLRAQKEDRVGSKRNSTIKLSSETKLWGRPRNRTPRSASAAAFNEGACSFRPRTRTTTGTFPHWRGAGDTE